MKNTIAMWIVIAVLAAILLFFVMKKIGLVKTVQEHKTAKQKTIAARDSEIAVAKDKAVQKNVVNVISKSTYFKPAYYKTAGSLNLLSSVEAKKAAENIKDAWGIINDDEEQVYGVFRSLTHKVQVSQIAEAYNKEYNEDLAGELISRLGKDELKMIYDITDALE
jgi:hypothetical protein